MLSLLGSSYLIFSLFQSDICLALIVAVYFLPDVCLMFFFSCCVLLSVYFPSTDWKTCFNIHKRINSSVCKFAAEEQWHWIQSDGMCGERVPTHARMHSALHSADFASYTYTLWVMILFNKLVNKSLHSQSQEAQPSARANIEMLLMLPRTLVSINLHRDQAEMDSKCCNEWYRYWLLK